jgi:hypothetical protein
MRSLIVMALFLGGCSAGKLAADRDTIRAQGSQDLGCTNKAELVYYGLRGQDIQGASACFGPTADALAVVECDGKRRAYWRQNGAWSAREGEVTKVDESGIEISLPGAENASGSVSAVARCGR